MRPTQAMEADMDREFHSPEYQGMVQILHSRREGRGPGWTLVLHLPCPTKKCSPRKARVGLIRGSHVHRHMLFLFQNIVQKRSSPPGSLP